MPDVRTRLATCFVCLEVKATQKNQKVYSLVGRLPPGTMWALCNPVYFLSALEPKALHLNNCTFFLVPYDLSSSHTHLVFSAVSLLPFRVYQDVSLLVRFRVPLERMELDGTTTEKITNANTVLSKVSLIFVALALHLCPYY